MKCKAAYGISALTFLVVHGFLQSLVGKCKAPKNILDWLVSDFLAAYVLFYVIRSYVQDCLTLFNIVVVHSRFTQLCRGLHISRPGNLTLQLNNIQHCLST